MTAEIVFAPAARRELKKLTKQVQKVVVSTAEKLAKNPRPRGVEKISGHPDFLRIKAGRNHRIIYQIFNDNFVLILVVRDRNDAYRGLDSLDDKAATALSCLDEAIRIRLGVG